MRTLKTVATVTAQLGLVLVANACGGEAERDAATQPTGGGAPGATTSGSGGTAATEPQTSANVTGGENTTSASGDVGGAGADGETTTSASGGAGGTGSVTTQGWVSTTGTVCGNTFIPCECSTEATPIGLDEVSNAWATANDILAFAGGTHQATLSYASDLGVATLDFPNETTTLELRIESLGTARNMAGMHIPANSPYCVSALGIDVKGTLTSEDGAFAEEFTTTLTATSPDFAQLSIPLSIAEMTGSFSPGFESTTVAMSDQMELTAHFGPGVFAGELVAEFTPCDSAGCQLPTAKISSWGYCPFGGFSLDTTEDERVVLSDVLDVWDSIPPLEAEWGDGTSSPVTLELSVDETGLCRESDRYRFHGQLELNTEDGRLSTSLGVDVMYLFDDYSRSVLADGPSGDGDPLVQHFELYYGEELNSTITTFYGSVVRYPAGGAEEVYFRTPWQ